MKKREVIRQIKGSIEHINMLIAKAKGEESRCAVDSLEDSVLYIETWIKHPIVNALEELER